MRGPLGIGDLFSLPVDLGMDTSLEFKHWAPLTAPPLLGIKKSKDIFKAIRAQVNQSNQIQ
jgi:hypothetical protein